MNHRFSQTFRESFDTHSMRIRERMNGGTANTEHILRSLVRLASTRHINTFMNEGIFKQCNTKH
jgi:hypothetical protein